MKSSRLLATRAMATLAIPIAVGVSEITLAQDKDKEAVKPTISGKFLGNGKAADLKFLSVAEREAFADKEALKLMFTEKDPAKSRNPETDAFFGEFGSALMLSVHYDGEIFGCEVAHSAHEKSGFSSVGRIRMEDFKMADGKVSGHVTTGGTLDTFGEKWEVDLKFTAPLPEKPGTPGATPDEPVEAPEEPAPADAPAPPAAPMAPTVLVKDLPLPKDASEVQFKAIVHQIELSSGQPVAAVADELSAALGKQGWKEGVGSLKGPKNAILKRELGDASLTIMIQPTADGSLVRIFVDGLDWEGAGK